jgi:hypothetical protein
MKYSNIVTFSNLTVTRTTQEERLLYAKVALVNILPQGVEIPSDFEVTHTESYNYIQPGDSPLCVRTEIDLGDDVTPSTIHAAAWEEVRKVSYPISSTELQTYMDANEIGMDEVLNYLKGRFGGV